MRAIITHLDDINIEISGVKRSDMALLIKKTSVKDPTAFTQAAYRIGTWDGLIPFIEDNISFSYLVPQIKKFLETLDYEVLIDKSTLNSQLPLITIDENFLLKETGKKLREHQVRGANIVLNQHKGVLEYSTSSGKTLLCLAVSKALDPYMKSLVVVPNQQLLDQTYKDYSSSDLSVLKLSASVKPNKREEMIASHRHIIVTDKLFVPLAPVFARETYAFIKDETQVFGETLQDALRFDTPNFPIRIGLTGSFPKCKLKSTKIMCHLGGGILDKVEPQDMKNIGATSKEIIKIVRTKHHEIDGLFDELKTNGMYDWSVEQDYYLSNKDRAVAIGDYIMNLPKSNTLVLCHANFGVLLGKYLNMPMINDDVDVSTRAEYFSMFDKSNDDYIQLASFGCAATGISVNTIHRVVLIDIGKNRTYILQSIGRGLRKSEHQEHVEVIDIYADMKYGNKHKAERVAIYKEKNFDYTDTDEIITIK